MNIQFDFLSRRVGIQNDPSYPTVQEVLIDCLSKGESVTVETIGMLWWRGFISGSEFDLLIARTETYF